MKMKMETETETETDYTAKKYDKCPWGDAKYNPPQYAIQLPGPP